MIEDRPKSAQAVREIAKFFFLKAIGKVLGIVYRANATQQVRRVLVHEE